MQLKKGDVVKLKSGGPNMTISFIDNEFGTMFECQWFDKGELKHATFSPETLEKVS